jgi:hypothetical protein
MMGREARAKQSVEKAKAAGYKKPHKKELQIWTRDDILTALGRSKVYREGTIFKEGNA